MSVNLLILPLNIGIAWMLTKAGLHYLFATATGVGLQLVLTFFISRRWTFDRSEIKAKSGLLRTTMVELVSMTNILFITAIGVELFKLEFTLARISAMTIAGILGYVLDSFFTFRTSPFR